MEIQLNINPAGSGALAAALAERLRSLPAARLIVSIGTAAPLATSLKLLLDFERLLFRLPAEPGPPAASPAASARPAGEKALLIDLADDTQLSQHHRRTLRVQFDSGYGEDRLFAALLASRLPLIQIIDANGHVRASGTPSTDNAETLVQAAQGVYARVVTLVMQAIAAPQDLTTTPARAPAAAPLPTALGLANIEVRNLAHAATRRLYHLCCYAPHWRIGWRFHDGAGVAERGDLGGAPWQVLADPGTRFYADPMPINIDGRSYVFFEDFPHRTQKGIISYVELNAAGPIGPVRVALEEPWHLSYPFLIRHQGQVFMVPESSQNREVVLYRADPFPTRWVRHATLLSDISLSDATILEDGGRFWMFGCTSDGAGSPSDMLSVYWADRLEGPWRPHQHSPVLIDPIGARPAGPCLRFGGKLWRVTQDCSSGYGRAVALVEILKLTPQAYEQRLVSVIRPDTAWPGRRFHPVTRDYRLECVDGSASAPKSRLVSKLFFPDRNAMDYTAEARYPDDGKTINSIARGRP
jgi:hypothetical protein